MKSLADVLGVANPIDKDALQPTRIPDETTIDGFCKLVLESREYRESIFRRIVLDELPQNVEMNLWNRAYGKVPDTLQIEDKRELSDVEVETLRAELDQLKQMAGQLLEKKKPTTQPTKSVH